LVSLGAGFLPPAVVLVFRLEAIGAYK